MAINITKYIRIFFLYLKYSYLVALEYRANFVLAFVATSLHTLGYLAFMNAVLSQVPSISGWTFDRMLTLFAINQVMIYLSWAIFRYSLAMLPEKIKDGSFDLVLKQPINARFGISFKEQNPEVPLPMITAISILIYSLRDVSITLPDVFGFTIFFVSGFIILYNVLFSLISLSFRIIEGQDLAGAAEQLFSYSRYPLAIFPTPARVFFLLVIPILLVVYVPATNLLGIFDPRLGILSLAMAIFTFLVSKIIWSIGLRRYSSASS